MGVKTIRNKLLKILKGTTFDNSSEYWNNRYNTGGNSGKGSYGKFAEFKAEVINGFLAKNKAKDIIEFGCGDGNQLTYFANQKYTGIDISQKVIDTNKNNFHSNTNLNFMLLVDFKKHPFSADVTMSLDVIYHLVEDHVFDEHMRLLFTHAKNFVIIYSSNREIEQKQPHVKHRKFDDWVAANAEFDLIEHIANPHDIVADKLNYSHADFYIYKRKREDNT